MAALGQTAACRAVIAIASSEPAPAGSTRTPGGEDHREVAKPPASEERGRLANTMTSVFEPEWDAEQHQPPFRWRRARVGRQAGSQRLGASLYELPPGASSWPLHIHNANEELVVVLAGRPTLRTLDDERELEPGEVVACPAGPGGAHRLDNRTSETTQVLVVSTMIAPELNEYPDSGKLWGLAFAPGGERDPEAADILGRPENNLGYFEGES